MNVFIHNHCWLEGDKDLLDALSKSVIGHGHTCLKMCKQLHALLEAGDGSYFYGDADGTVVVITSKKYAHGLAVQDGCKDEDTIYVWDDESFHIRYAGPGALTYKDGRDTGYIFSMENSEFYGGWRTDLLPTLTRDHMIGIEISLQELTKD